MLLAGLVGMLAALVILSQVATSKSMTLLYSGLERGAAGDVVAALEQSGVQYDVRGDSIYVESSARDELRMVLAGQGLPANGNAGYELLDGLSGFGTTSQMFDAAYWRAKEGELARTIMTSPQIRSARVHISNQTTRGFRRGTTPTASVLLSSAAGDVTAAQGRAIRFLVASAVSGLKPSEVSVIDGDTGLVLGSVDTAPGVGRNQAAELKSNIIRLLEAHVGPGNAVVELSLETVTERESIVERRYDPDSRVAISSDTTTTSSSSNGSQSGAVTVASNLPDGDAAGDGSSNSTKSSENRERINYEVSETTREVLKSPGAIKRLTVAVLVNGAEEIGADGETTIVPRSEEELGALQELVGAAIGLDETRGDQITIKSMEFRAFETSASIPVSSIANRLDPMAIIQVGILAVVVLILGLFVVRPILNRPKPQNVLEISPPETGAETSPGPTGDVAEPGALPPLNVAGDMSGGMAKDLDLLPSLPMQSDDPVARLRQMIEERQSETVEVLRSWMEDDKEKA
ncbi:flagellar M-ring protein FliF [Aliiruegeria haliotis]|uniref:Flagellar M-ring protein n=1 Tax=Aliiruegeria haliotis TaxID=1280846 RepID=A0A2T0RT92_9RHOB|nr:flagellar M-ring protein FliF [Aliiruegeria haliotis]